LPHSTSNKNLDAVRKKDIYNKNMENMAKDLGKMLRENPEMMDQPSANTDYGKLDCFRKPVKNESIPPSHEGKRAILWLGDEYVVHHTWGESYVGDPKYFRNLYETSKKVLADESIPTPKLISSDDETMTLVMERLDRDLSVYLESDDRQQAEQVVDRVEQFLKGVWENSKTDNMGFPRYVSAFLEPEYEFLKAKKIEDYISGDDLELYREVQQELKEYTKSIEEKGFESGFGLADVKLDNLVEDNHGNIYFIDVAKPEEVHWVTMLGQIYEDALTKNPDSLLIDVLEKRCAQLFEEDEINKDHFKIGRLNRILLPCTLRNVTYNVEVGNSTAYLNEKLTAAKSFLA
jgi:hypothetical protein